MNKILDQWLTKLYVLVYLNNDSYQVLGYAFPFEKIAQLL